MEQVFIGIGVSLVVLFILIPAITIVFLGYLTLLGKLFEWLWNRGWRL